LVKRSQGQLPNIKAEYCLGSIRWLFPLSGKLRSPSHVWSKQVLSREYDHWETASLL